MLTFVYLRFGARNPRADIAGPVSSRNRTGRRGPFVECRPVFCAMGISLALAISVVLPARARPKITIESAILPLPAKKPASIPLFVH